MHVVPAIQSDDARELAYAAASERRKRIEAFKVDRSHLPSERLLKPSPPQALRAEERLKTLRAHDAETRLELLRAWWTRAKAAGDIPREPIARRA